VLPEFQDLAAAREHSKRDELAPYLEDALGRKQRMRELNDEEIPTLAALGRQIVQQMPEQAKQSVSDVQGGSGVAVPLSDPNEKAGG
jgi:hypothetical protein